MPRLALSARDHPVLHLCVLAEYKQLEDKIFNNGFANMLPETREAVIYSFI